MSDRQRWTEQVTTALDLDQAVLMQVTDPVLDMVRDVAHGVNRPSAPLTAFLVGLAAGRAAGSGPVDPAQVEAALATVGRLAEQWEPTAD